ncbi:MAG: DNA repair protein RecO [Alphaproteobacteria bacterium]
MKLESFGILIELRPFGERDCLSRIFTKDYGILSGMMKGANVTKRNKPLMGQFGAVSWNARLDSQLGVFHWESEKNLSASLMSDVKALGFMNSSFSLLSTLLPERENYESLWYQTKEMLENLSKPDASYLYLNWEIDLLQELGYALDLSKCSNCGRTDNLTHISPRTARAVCKECAKPYLDKLYSLPINFETTKNFLEKIIVEQGIKELPLARKLI